MDILIREEKNLECLMDWRREVIENVFGVIPDDVLLGANRDYYQIHVPDGTHKAFVASYEGKDCGCGGICFTDELPSPDNPTGRCAYLMNIYVRAGFRTHGVAHAIVRRLIDEARSSSCGKIYLETTAAGKSVYSSIGFKDMPDMMKLYDKDI